MKKIIFLVLLTVILGSSVITYKFLFSPSSIASDGASSVSTQTQWENGSITGSLDLSSTPGSMKLSLVNSEIDIEQIYTDDNSSVLTDRDADIRGYSVDGSELTAWPGFQVDPPPWWWRIDLGEVYSLSEMRILCEPTSLSSMRLQVSNDDTTYTTVQIKEGDLWSNYDIDCSAGDSPGTWDNYTFSASGRYIRLYTDATGGHATYEINLYSYPLGTHTTAATQIDGQEGSEDKDVIEWTSFTPTQTTPANTSISYEFRTSDDGTTWSAWSASQTYSDTALDLTALTPSRYLQVRSTLSTTDAAVTPQIDDYTINFHNNEAPDAPTAQTAVISR